MPTNCDSTLQVGHGMGAFFWTEEYKPNDCQDATAPDILGYDKQGCVMVSGMGIIVGDYGRILRTTDGGDSWESVSSPTSSHLRGVSMNEENTHSGSLHYDATVRHDSEETCGTAAPDSSLHTVGRKM